MWLREPGTPFDNNERNRKDARSNPGRYLPWNYKGGEVESLAA
jgi:hypothetical protein